MFQPVASAIDLEAALADAGERPIVLFKHSAWCGVSATARRRLADFAAAGEVPVYEVVVQEARAISNAIAEQFGIRHETPQVIVVRGGEAVYHASHGRIHPDPIRTAVRRARTSNES